MQTVKTLLEQFHVNIKLTEIINNKEINGEFTKYYLNHDEKDRSQHVFEGTVLTPKVHPDTMKRLPDWLKERMSQGHILEKCKIILTPEDKDIKYLYIETWSEECGGFSVFYDSDGEERGRS